MITTIIIEQILMVYKIARRINGRASEHKKKKYKIVLKLQYEKFIFNDQLFNHTLDNFKTNITYIHKKRREHNKKLFNRVKQKKNKRVDDGEIKLI